MNSKEQRIEANKFGEFAEEKAVEEYRSRGYTVLERNWRMGKTEIDIIAQKDDIIIIAEVKARNTNEEDALSSITSDKKRRMVRAADNYIKRLQGNYSYRFDVVACSGTISNLEMEIYEDAFLAADLF